jgi:hypothetical protein
MQHRVRRRRISHTSATFTIKEEEEEEEEEERDPRTTSTIREPEPGTEVVQKLLEEGGGDRFSTGVGGDLIANSQHPDHTPRSVSRSVPCVT